MDKYVLSMASIRMISGCIELLAAFFMLRLHSTENALAINSMLAMVGPLVLIMTTTIGFIGIADKLSWDKMAWVGAGVLCLMIGILKK